MRKMLCFDNEHVKNWGLLILRVGIGLIFMGHGIPKLFAGVEVWKMLGSAMSHLGINVGYAGWGFLAALSEAVGGLCLIIGLQVRLAATFMAIVMLVATNMHYVQGGSWSTVAHPLSLFFVFVALMCMGGGVYSIDARCR